MNHELGAKCYSLYLRDYPQSEIAKKLNITQPTVSRQIKKIIKSREYELGALTVNSFLDVFKKAEQYWNESNKEYRELIDQVQKLNDNRYNEKDKYTQKSKTDKVLLQVELISKLIDKQDKNMERILTLAKEGETVLALKVARDILRKHAPSYDEIHFRLPLK